MAEEAYGVSDAAQKVHDVALDLISAIQDNTKTYGAWRFGYEESQALSRGQAGGIRKLLGLDGDGEADSGVGMTAYMGLYAPDAVPMDQMMGFGSSHAFGLDRVPYDGYPALLHEGERVLTAREARRADRGGGAPAVQVTVTGNHFYGSDSAMEERVARRIAREVRRAVLLAAP